MSDKKAIIFADEAADYEALCAGVRSLGASPIALFAGSQDDAERIAGFGARVLYVGEIPEGALFEDCTQVFGLLIATEQPALILATMTKRTQCVAGRLAIRLGLPVVTDASHITIVDEGVEATRLVYGGAAERVVRSTGAAIALVSSGLFELDANHQPGVVERQECAVEAGPIKLLGRQEKQEESVDLGSAKVVVCVGRGIQNERNVATAKEVAVHLGGEMACTRPIAEGEGWMARSRYLGVSGATVKPDVYLGLGVSGQVQHTVGMRESQTVIAVNKDKNAPIMKQCDVGLIADVEKVLPALLSL